ncbi:MAG TPA: hypothetical protein VJ813_19950 [Vicinamibacterales bacterium]|nr:hypothetical protein [Vicinamibacterales bacterium]
MRTMTIALLLGIALPDAAQERPLPFTSGWDLQGDRTAVVKDAGREVLQVETGFGHRRDVRIQDGTIDFDVQVTRRRSFVYVYFRVVADGEREEFYLRPHKSGLPDAVQYAPVWQNKSAWQLHHGPGGTAAIAFDPGAWTHVRVVMQGRRAAIFVKDMTTPALTVPRLAREPQAGHIAIGGFLPADVPGEGAIARFSNVVVRSEVSFDFAAAPAQKGSDARPAAASTPAASEPAETIVTTWSVSRSFVPKDESVPTLPGRDITGEFMKLDTEADGLLQLHRHITVPQGSRVAAAVARVNVRAARAGTYAFDVGFSDIATVFVNGKPVFRGEASYSFDQPRREGLIGYDQARIYLALPAGDTDLAIVVSDTFGGWGIMARFVNAFGVTAGAR